MKNLGGSVAKMWLLIENFVKNIVDQPVVSRQNITFDNLVPLYLERLWSVLSIQQI